MGDMSGGSLSQVSQVLRDQKVSGLHGYQLHPQRLGTFLDSTQDPTQDTGQQGPDMSSGSEIYRLVLRVQL